MSNAIKQINKLFITNLPWTVGQTQLKKYFAEFGQVVNATVLFDKSTGLSKGYGFVSFSNSEAIDKVFNTASHVLEGNKLNIQPSDVHYKPNNNRT